MLARPVAFARKMVLGFSVLVAAVWGPRAALDAADAPPINGTWKILVEGERDYILELRSEGEKVGGTFISPRSGRYPIESGKYSGGKLRIEVPRKGEEATRVFVIEAEWKGERFEGTLHVNGEGSGTLTITREKRPASLAGKWKVVSKTGDGQEYASVMDLAEAEGRLRGKASSELGTFDLRELGFEDGKLSFQITLPIQGNDTAFQVNAELKNERVLEGRWKVQDADITGEWRAEREAPPEKAPEADGEKAGVKALEGEWFGISTHPDGQKRGFLLTFKVQGDSLTGTLLGSEGQEHALKAVKLQGQKLEFSINLGDNEGKVEGELKNGVLGGKWAIGSESGEWSSRKPSSF